MGAFPQQRHITIDGRPFHFVAYEGQPENRKRNQASEPAMWYLMVSGRRFPVGPFVATHSPEQLDKLLCKWVAANIGA